jgi:hypothetical protein
MNLSKLLSSAVVAAFLLLLCLALNGCSSARRAAVEGSVSLDGQPVDGGIIVFAPEEYRENGIERAVVKADIKDGKYSLDPAQGPVVGNYRVEIHWKKKTGRLVPSDDPPGTKHEEVEVIPRVYHEGSRTVVEIKPGDNKFDYPLRSKFDETRPGRRGPGNSNNN